MEGAIPVGERRSVLSRLALVAMVVVMVSTTALLQLTFVLEVQVSLFGFMLPVGLGLGLGLLFDKLVAYRFAERQWRRTLQHQQKVVRSLNEGLELRIQERTRALRAKEHELAQAQKVQAVGALAAGIAHDFNNILAAVVGAAELLEEMVPASDGEAQEVVREVLAAGERGRGLTRQLLTLSRKQAHTPQELRLQDVVADMQDMLRRLIPAPIVFETRLSESCDPVWADRSMVEQVVLNLCVNARDAMPAGGTVTVGVAQIDQAGITDSSDGAKPGYVRLWVSDSGEGMSEQVQAGIFDPFFTTKPSHKGTGLGLSVVQSIVAIHKATISVTSELRLGSQFEVFFPLIEARSLPATIRAPGASGDDHEGVVPCEPSPDRGAASEN